MQTESDIRRQRWGEMIGEWALDAMRLYFSPARAAGDLVRASGKAMVAEIQRVRRDTKQHMRRTTPIAGASREVLRRITSHGGDKLVLIAGAGLIGESLAREMKADPRGWFTPVGFVDDDLRRQGQKVADLPVFGRLDATPQILRQQGIDFLAVAMPEASGATLRSLVRMALDAGISVRTVPSLYARLGGPPGHGLREITIDDLLRRDPVETDLPSVAGIITARTVMVTGAGGIIGEELCRQIARLRPTSLLLFDVAEAALTSVTSALEHAFPDVRIQPIIGDIRSAQQVQKVLGHYRPNAIFHAAALRSIPLLEDHVAAAILTNVYGTRNLVDAATDVGVDHFVLISTDKAVNATSAMGATKRIAEQIVLEASDRTHRNFVIVRFGNVLGRSGVVQDFVSQIQRGGPIAVTHPEMQRYFMTVPEAVQLVLQALALGSGGEVFVLDMGEPVKIIDLATDLIRLSGFEPGRDIDVKYTGIRPGEKLYEEMFFRDEQILPTQHPKLLRARARRINMWSSRLLNQLIEDSQEFSLENNDLKAMLSKVVPEYAPWFNPTEPPPHAKIDSSMNHGRAAGA